MALGEEVLELLLYGEVGDARAGGPLVVVHAADVIVCEGHPKSTAGVLVGGALVHARQGLVAKRAVELVQELGHHADGDEAVLVRELRHDGRGRGRAGTRRAERVELGDGARVPAEARGVPGGGVRGESQTTETAVVAISGRGARIAAAKRSARTKADAAPESGRRRMPDGANVTREVASSLWSRPPRHPGV